jgi:ATP diphosphatase
MVIQSSRIRGVSYVKQADSRLSLDKLLTIMEALRDPKSGCPWDIEQSYRTIVPYTIEEVYEVVDAIEREDYSSLKDELGDLLFQVVFYCQLAKEDKYFEFDDVLQSLTDKLTRRHPHVFAEKTYSNPEQVNLAWEKQKQKEREQKCEHGEASLIDDIPKVLPQLKRAQKIQKRVAKHGFDWSCISQVWEKVDEEILEVKQAIDSNDQDALVDEIGDLLFSVVNLSRHLDVDADSALRTANRKFEQRFRVVESLATVPLSEYSLTELEQLWQKAKIITANH